MEKQDYLIIAICVSLLFLWFSNFSPTVPPTAIPTPSSVEKSNTNSPQKSVLSDIDPGQSLNKTLDDQNDDKQSRNFLVKIPDEYSLLPSSTPIKLTCSPYVELIVDPDKGAVLSIRFMEYLDQTGENELLITFDHYPILELQNKNKKLQFSHAKIVKLNALSLHISRALYDTNLIIEQEWVLNPNNPYEIDYIIRAINHGQNDEKMEGLIVNSGAMLPIASGNNFMGASGIDQRIDILYDGETSPKTILREKIIDLSQNDYEKESQKSLKWLAVQNKYFASIIRSETTFPSCEFAALSIPTESQHGKDKADLLTGGVRLPAKTIDAGNQEQWILHAYIGPKKYGHLKQLTDNQESLLQFDLFLFFNFRWMKMISLGVLWLLNHLEAICHNYGIAIILTTIIIRALFWPITHQSTIWSKKMQAIQPVLSEIREKYKSDPMKMNQKTMEFYRENKINPFAGCLPVLLQIPVFFALFNVLRSAIELRQARFLWAHDLSIQDTVMLIPIIGIPINPIAILMGITMLYQQKMMPTGVDPIQQKVMLVMTGFFIIILYTMPSGLTLYWTVNQLISILQYRITRRMEVALPTAKIT